MDFRSVTIQLIDGDGDCELQAINNGKSLELSISRIEERLTLSESSMNMFRYVDRRGDLGDDQIQELINHPVSSAIRGLPTPIFLPLSRRYEEGSGERGDFLTRRRRESISRRSWVEDEGGGQEAENDLGQVQRLVEVCSKTIAARTRELDDELRANVFKKALEYKSFNRDFSAGKLNIEDIKRYREQLDRIKSASHVAGIPSGEIDLALSKFYDELEKVAKSIQGDDKHGEGQSRQPGRTGKRGGGKLDLFQWFLNQPTIDRISEHLKLLADYVEDRDRLSEQMNRFLKLVNRFYEQTGKRLSLNREGRLLVQIGSDDPGKDLTVLSSGERQLLIILAQLSLNSRLGSSGVFIVDEPELSLHLAWQELFVDAIIEANSDVQFILATHSPAIILDRGTHCRYL